MPAAPPLKLAGVSVLVIEHNEDVRGLLMLLLGYAGALATGTGGGREALVKLEAEPIQPDVILCALHSRGMSGYAFLARLREKASFGQIPVIAMSDERTRAGLLKIHDAGFQGHLRMPFEEKAIHEEIQRVLRRS
jgi:CheY-like chemotaxis protein